MVHYSLLMYCQVPEFLAELIGINRNTVKLAYEEVMRLVRVGQNLPRTKEFVLSKLQFQK